MNASHQIFRSVGIVASAMYVLFGCDSRTDIKADAQLANRPFYFSESEIVDLTCDFDTDARFVRRKQTVSIKSYDGSTAVSAIKGIPENQFIVEDLTNDTSFVVEHANSLVKFDDFAFDRDGRSIAFIGRPRSGMNGAEIYSFNLDNGSYSTFGNGAQNFAAPLALPTDEDGPDQLFVYVATSSLPGIDKTREQVLNFDPVTWVPAIYVNETLHYVTEDLEYTSDPDVALRQGLRVWPRSSFYGAQGPVSYSSAWWRSENEMTIRLLLGPSNRGSSLPELAIERSAQEIARHGRTFPDAAPVEPSTKICVNSSVYTTPYPYNSD